MTARREDPDRSVTRLGVYVVLDAATLAPGRDLPGLAVAAAAGGAGTLQVRDKNAAGRALYELVQRVAEALTRAGADVDLLVNDRVDVAVAARLAGLAVTGAHIGQSDLPPAAARAVLGPHAVLGLSAGTSGQVAAVSDLPAGTVDYLGVRPVHATVTKPDADRPIGQQGAAVLAAATSLPCVGIGGLTAADAAWMRTSGLAGLAVVSAVSLAPDPQAATRAIATAWARAQAQTPVAASEGAG